MTTARKKCPNCRRMLEESAFSQGREVCRPCRAEVERERRRSLLPVDEGTPPWLVEFKREWRERYAKAGIMNVQFTPDRPPSEPGSRVALGSSRRPVPRGRP